MNDYNDDEATKTSHGPFEEASRIAQALKLVMRSGRNWEGLQHDSKEALEMTATQIARILTGDQHDPKHWTRASGYLRLRGSALQGIEGGLAKITARIRPHVLEPYERTLRQPPDGAA